jgi:uncharacterized repeat protein (TIGR01451 family)
MYRNAALLLLSTLVILGLAGPTRRVPSVAYAQDTSQSDTWSLRVLEADAHHVLLELSLPSYGSETIVDDGIAYERLRVAGWPRWGQPGQPELPMHSVPLGMPAPGRPQVTVIEAESRTVEGVLLYPAPALELDGDGETPQIVEAFTLDPDAYSADTTYPGALAEAASIGLLRDQPLFQLRLYPFQYNPLRRELRVHHRLRVLVTFPAGALSVAEAGCAEPPPVFDGILERTLLNYDSLPRPTCHSTGASIVPLDALDSGPHVKLLVEQSGLYRVTHADLLAVAPDLIQSDPRRLQLSNQGTTIPMRFEGEADGTFDPGDSFLFYGQAIHSDYTRHNVYWLSDAGAPGLRMAERDGTPGTGTTPVTPTAFADSRHYEEDHLYWRAVPEGEGSDHWFWDKLVVNSSTPVAADYTFDLHHIAASGPDGELRLMLHGLTSGDHLAQLYLNGVALLSPAEQAWSGQIAKLYGIAVPQDLFVENANHLRVESMLPAGSSISSFYVNWFEVTYQDTYVAEDDHLSFSAPSAGSYNFELTGFSTNDIELFEITDPAAPVRIVNAALEPDRGGYRLRFGDSATADRRYLAQWVDQLPTPSLQLDEPSAWKSTANGATYVIVTHPDFYSRLQSLAAYRASQGETVVIVKTEDLYDEFYHGITDPQAIRSFLEYAYENWSPRPVYVLLVGDASMDPKNNRGSSYPDLLPARYVDTPVFGQAPNDSWYARVHGDDDYPDLIVGRIPARWGSNVDTVTQKVQVYEGSPPPGGWVRRAVLVADDDDPAFAQDMDTIVDLLPASITPVEMYDYDPNTSVKREVNVGTLLLVYSGHGNVHWWGNWGGRSIFDQSDIKDLQNGDKLPFVTVANCLNGFFADYASARSMAEEFLLRSNKAAIASWAPASYGFVSTNSVILEELHEALLIDNDLILGSAATTARIQAHLRQPDKPLSLFEVFTYFGDPAVRLNLPATLELAGGDAPDPITMGELLTYTLTYTVSGADQARGLTLVDTLPQGTTYQSASPQPSSIYRRTLTWNLGDTPAGSYTLTVSARVGTDGLAHGQVLRNEAHLYDATGGDQFLEIETTVRDVPIAGLLASNDSPTELGDPTTLLAATTCGTNVVYTWDFDDGTPAGTGSSVEHTYPAIGTYLAQVTASNGVSSQSQTTTITITDVPPAASFTSSSPDRIGQATTFQSTSRGTNLTYRWDFGDGSPPVDGQTPIITHTYALTGTHTAGLTITNSVGTSTVSGTVAILPEVEPPVARFISSSPDEIGQTTVFTSTSQDGGDDEENVIYAWDFGDGTYSAVQHPTHTYAVRGTHLVSLTISNSVATDTFSDTVLITDAPITGLAISHDSPTVLGHTTALSATVASGTHISYLWALGDGTWSTGQNLTHTYRAVGNYGVVLTATNSMGSQVITDTVVVVDEPIEGLTLAHSGPTALRSATAFTASITAGSNVSYLWDLGDGRTSTLQNPIHTYAALGDYTVVLTATNGWGSLVRSDTVSIRDVPISGLSVSHDGPTTLGTPTTFTADVAAGTNVIYNWELGDGHVATGAHLTHTYAIPGTYSVTVTALNSMNDDEASTNVTVLEPGRLVYLPLVFRNGSP